MATVEVTFESPAEIAGGPLHNADPASTQIMTSSGSSQVSTAAATHSGQTLSVTSNGGAIRLEIGSGTPDAATGRFIVPAGATRSWGNIKQGHKAAIIDLA